jgi:hypothetical protein
MAKQHDDLNEERPSQDNLSNEGSFHATNEVPDYLGDDTDFSQERVKKPLKIEKTDVSEYDKFKFAKWVIGIAVGIYLAFALIRIFYTDPAGYDKSGIKDVWEYSKVVINSVISLVLGLYFGTKHDSKK